MNYTIGLVFVASGLNGENIYALIYSPEGNVQSQVAPKNVAHAIFNVDNAEHIKQVVTEKDWNPLGYAIADDADPQEVQDVLQMMDDVEDGIAIDLSEEYLTTEAALVVRKHPLFPVLESWLYRI